MGIIIPIKSTEEKEFSEHMRNVETELANYHNEYEKRKRDKYAENYKQALENIKNYNRWSRDRWGQTWGLFHCSLRYCNHIPDQIDCQSYAKAAEKLSLYHDYKKGRNNGVISIWPEEPNWIKMRLTQFFG